MCPGKCGWLCRFTYLHIPVHMFIYIYMCVCVCLCVWYICVCVCVCMCMCVCCQVLGVGITFSISSIRSCLLLGIGVVHILSPQNYHTFGKSPRDSRPFFYINDVLRRMEGRVGLAACLSTNQWKGDHHDTDLLMPIDKCKQFCPLISRLHM